MDINVQVFKDEFGEFYVVIYRFGQIKLPLIFLELRELDKIYSKVQTQIKEFKRK